VAEVVEVTQLVFEIGNRDVGVAQDVDDVLDVGVGAPREGLKLQQIADRHDRERLLDLHHHVQLLIGLERNGPAAVRFPGAVADVRRYLLRIENTRGHHGQRQRYGRSIPHLRSSSTS